MAGSESFVQVTSGAGPKPHTWQRTIGANNVEDEFVIPGEYPYASYIVLASGISAATASDHLLQIMAGASLPVRLRRIRIEQRALATTQARVSIDIFRLSTAGTGGAAITPRPFDTADAASGCTAMSLPTAKGTESIQLMSTTLHSTQAGSATVTNPEEMFEWYQLPNAKPIIIPAGAANGLAIKNVAAQAGLTLTITVELVETNFV